MATMDRWSMILPMHLCETLGIKHRFTLPLIRDVQQGKAFQRTPPGCWFTHCFERAEVLKALPVHNGTIHLKIT